jgi:aspartate/methionine/tyrosine aminotransferase
MPRISDRTRGLGTENAFVVLKEVNDRIAQGADIISFCIGQPDFVTPEPIREAAVKAIRDGHTGYTPSAGIPKLREAAARYLSRTRGVAVAPEEVVVGGGAKPFIGYAVLSCTDYGKGDEVIYPCPGFPIYEAQIVAHGAVPVPLPLREARAFSFDIDDLAGRVTSRTKLLILNSPQNPTGGILSAEDLDRIARIAAEHDLWVYADEIYSRLVYGGRFESVVSRPGMKERTILCDGVSKTYAMTGWRLGFAANPILAERLATWVTNTDSCASHISQWAAVEALNGSQEEARSMADRFHRRRDLVVKLLNEVPGFRCLCPGGAFYVWPNVTEACRQVGAPDSEAFRRRLLLEAGVAVLADIHFGRRVEGEGMHIRLSYAASEEQIERGVARIADFMRRQEQALT